VALRSGHNARSIVVAALAAVAVFAMTVPARAEDTTASSMRAAAAKRATTSLTNGTFQSDVGTANRSATSFANGFLYFQGTQPGVVVNGRVPVGKSHVYVPYYGNVSNDPTHPGVQGSAGIAYGFRTWDISVLNGGFGTPQQTLPGLDPPKANPALSFSVHF